MNNAHREYLAFLAFCKDEKQPGHKPWSKVNETEKDAYRIIVDAKVEEFTKEHQS